MNAFRSAATIRLLAEVGRAGERGIGGTHHSAKALPPPWIIGPVGSIAVTAENCVVEIVDQGAGAATHEGRLRPAQQPALHDDGIRRADPSEGRGKLDRTPRPPQQYQLPASGAQRSGECRQSVAVADEVVSFGEGQ